MTTIDLYLNDIWSRTIALAKQTNQIPDEVFQYFDSKLISLTDQEAKVLAPNFINFTIITQNYAVLESCLEEVCGNKIKLHVLNEDDISRTEPKEIDRNEFLTKSIDPAMTFENFVIGRSNIQAQTASLTCATNPGIAYNPLFIYGNSGLGKTHLLNAIGNKFNAIFPSKKIGYISGLEFVEIVYKASENRRLDDLKEVFKSLDLLLIDDVQFIAGKPKTHEIFFSIFNELVNNRKQICLTADRTPSEIKDLEDRLVSRFNQGLTCNIEAPEYETSINILKMKISNSSIIPLNVDDDVLNYLATNFSQDVRSLEGAVNRLLFYVVSFSQDEQRDHITLSMAMDAFKDQIKENKNELTISSVRRAVCDYYNLTKQQITSAARTKNIANARHIAMYLCRKLLDVPFAEIGAEFGKRDHSTVMSACERVEKLIKTDPLYLRAVNDIEAKLK